MSSRHSESATNREVEDTGKMIRRSAVAPLCLLAVLLISAVVYFFAIRPDTFGSYHDDSIYVTTAKALATGQGYRIISLPYEPAQTKYPPLYPLLLSAIWRIDPNFPQNLIPMMMLSIALTIGFLSLSYWYLTARGYAAQWQGLLVVSLTAANWRTVIVATGLYSEMLGAVISVAALSFLDTHPETKRPKLREIAAGLLIGLAFLTRSAGVALLMALVVYHTKNRHWRRVVVPTTIATVFVAAWVVWCYFNKSTANGVNVAYYTDYLAHFNEVINDLSLHNHATAAVTVLGIVARNAYMLVVESVPVVSLGLNYQSIVYLGFTLLFFVAGFVRQIAQGARLLHIYVICYLVLHFFWLPYAAYDRFLIPLLPFLLLLMVTELEFLYEGIKRNISRGRNPSMRIAAGFIAAAIIASAGILIYEYLGGLRDALASTSLKKSAGPSVEDSEAIDWVSSHTYPGSVLVCYRDPLYFLYTGRRATRSLAMKAGITWQENQPLIFDIVEQSHGDYLILTSSDFDNTYQPELQRESLSSLVRGHPDRFVRVFESTDGHSTIYRIEAGGNTDQSGTGISR